MRIYTDLDNVLVNPVMGGPQGYDVLRIVPRPEAEWFLAKLAGLGELWLLTASAGDHPWRALRTITPDFAKYFSGYITREQLAFIEEQIHVVKSAHVDPETRRELWSLIQPIGEPGVVFDDYPVGSRMFTMKATAVGIGPEDWIQVEPFAEGSPDRGGLRKAYAEFKRRYGLGTRLAGRQEVFA